MEIAMRETELSRACVDALLAAAAAAARPRSTMRSRTTWRSQSQAQALQPTAVHFAD